jgi:hypothetical protein
VVGIVAAVEGGDVRGCKGIRVGQAGAVGLAQRRIIGQQTEAYEEARLAAAHDLLQMKT